MKCQSCAPFPDPSVRKAQCSPGYVPYFRPNKLKPVLNSQNNMPRSLLFRVNCNRAVAVIAAKKVKLQIYLTERNKMNIECAMLMSLWHLQLFKSLPEFKVYRSVTHALCRHWFPPAGKHCGIS